MKSYTKLIIDTPTGQYELPLDVVARDRTEYYAGKEDFKEDSPEWESEMDCVLCDNFEGIDWLLNNMDWDDVKDKAKKINDKVLVTDDDFWTSSENISIE